MKYYARLNYSSIISLWTIYKKSKFFSDKKISCFQVYNTMVARKGFSSKEVYDIQVKPELERLNNE